VLSFRGVEMVCVACNGKGYVVERNRESVCCECQGRGECFLNDREKNHIPENQQVNAVH
jgi:DnaJ-class molecular chaperone